jgi:hypothetical protein
MTHVLLAFQLLNFTYSSVRIVRLKTCWRTTLHMYCTVASKRTSGTGISSSSIFSEELLV